MIKSDSIDQIIPALLLAKKFINNPVMDKTNPFFKSKYVDLAGIIDCVSVPLEDNGIIFSQILSSQDGKEGIETILFHSSGQYIGGFFPLMMSKDAQKQGATITYAKRYALQSICGITGEPDNDANETVQQPTKEVSNGNNW